MEPSPSPGGGWSGASLVLSAVWGYWHGHKLAQLSQGDERWCLQTWLAKNLSAINSNAEMVLEKHISRDVISL